MHVSRSTFHAFEGVTVHGREKEQRRLGELPKEGIQADYIGMEFVHVSSFCDTCYATHV